MDNFILAIIGLSFLQFMKGFFKSRGYSKKKMAVIGFCLSISMLALIFIVVLISDGGVALAKKLDMSGIALSIFMVLVFTITYGVEGKD